MPNAFHQKITRTDADNSEQMRLEMKQALISLDRCFQQPNKRSYRRTDALSRRTDIFITRTDAFSSEKLPSAVEKMVLAREKMLLAEERCF
jgi:hypothetical protein